MKPAPWLHPALGELRIAIVHAALAGVGICESPLNSNRGKEVDAINQRFHSPLGSFWCANFTGGVYAEAGAAVPPTEVGSVRRWFPWAKNLNLWRGTGYQPIPGDLVLYGRSPESANHMGIIVRAAPVVLSVEGNTSIGSFDRNGNFVALKRPETDRVVGYIMPKAKGT